MPLKPTVSLTGHSRRITRVAGVRSDTLVTASVDGTVKIWDIATGQCTHTFAHYGPVVSDIAVVDGGLAVITVGGRTMKTFYVLTKEIASTISSFTHELSACTAIDGHTVVAGDVERKLYVVDWVKSSFKLVEASVGIDYVDYLFSYGGKFVICSLDKYFGAGLRQRTPKNETTSITVNSRYSTLDSNVCSVTFDETYFITGSQDSIIRVFRISNVPGYVQNAQYTTISTHSKAVKFVHIVKSKNILLSGGMDNIVAIHILPSRRCIAKYDVGMPIYSMAAFSSGMIAVVGLNKAEALLFKIDELLQNMSCAACNEFSMAALEVDDEHVGESKVVEEQKVPISNTDAKLNQLPATQREDAVRHVFKAFVIGNQKPLTISQAVTAFYTTSTMLNIANQVSMAKFETHLQKYCSNSQVCEDKFVAAFQATITDSEIVDERE